MTESLAILIGDDPAAAILAFLGNANLVGGLGVLAMAAARPLARRVLGARPACQLWCLPPLAGLAYALMRHVHTAYEGATWPAGWIAPETVLAFWAAGALATAGVFVVCQLHFLRQVRAGVAGPAVVGLISPRIVMPADGTYTPEERELIRAHEREHVANKDPRTAAWAAVFQCLGWFNPLVHVATRMLRLDQELACDAAVVRNRPTQRALYARTLLKTQLAATPLPFGCHWPAPSAHPLEVRVAALKRPRGQPAVSGHAVVVASGEAIRP